MSDYDDGPASSTTLADAYDVLLARVRDLEQENAALRQRHAEMTQAVGLLTTLAPTMEMDGDHPLAMAQEIVRQVEQRHADMVAEFTALATLHAGELEEQEQRHAEAVEAAYREGYADMTNPEVGDAWLASEARKGLI